MRRLPPTLLALTPGDLTAADFKPFLSDAEAAIEAGLRGILLREPALGDRDLLHLALALRARLGSDGWLAVHDRVHLATASGADAVQLGFRSLAPADARALLPGPVAIGFSAHAGDPIETWTAADYLLLGPVFETSSKRGLLEPLGLDGFARELERATRPAWALGGITPPRTRELRDRGCAGIAVRGAVFGSSGPAPRVRSFLAAWDR